MEETLILIIVEDGVIQDIIMPDNIKVVIRDYDVDGVESAALSIDENDDYYMESVWINSQ